VRAEAAWHDGYDGESETKKEALVSANIIVTDGTRENAVAIIAVPA
jgi:hypothetical protein